MTSQQPAPAGELSDDAPVAVPPSAMLAFLAEAGRLLSASLHHRRCVRTTLELAVPHLADTAAVVLPTSRRHSGWMRLVAGGALTEGMLRDGTLGEVPGLAEALGGFPPVPSRWLDASQVPAWLLPADFGLKAE